MDLNIAGRRALVLGASRGLGAAIARSLAAEGAQVTAAARTPQRINDWRVQLPPDHAARIRAVAVDMADRHSVEALASGLLAGGGVDILITNGGGPPAGTAQGQSPDTWLRQFEAMAAHVFLLTDLLLPPMIERRWGRILSITSSGVEQPIPNLGLSNGVRAAVVGWSKTLAGEVAAHGITVNTILPGRIHTERLDELDSGAAQRSGKTVEQVADAIRATIPMGRYGRPEEFASVACFLVSDLASYITGSRIRVDGGLIKSI